MKSKFRIAKISIFLVVFIILSVIKGFTANITYKDDPTSTFVKSNRPLIINHYKFDPEENDYSSQKWISDQGFSNIYSKESSYTRQLVYNLCILTWWIQLVTIIRGLTKYIKRKDIIS